MTEATQERTKSGARIIEVSKNTAANKRVLSQLVQAADVGSVYGGVKVEGNVTPREALELAGLDWECQVSNTVWLGDKRTRVPGVRGTYATLPSGERVAFGIVRSKYTPIQNSRLAQLVEELTGSDSAACVSSCGALYGGKYVWMCIDLGGFDVLPGDENRKHLLCFLSHDGSTNLWADLTAARLACQNILNIGHSGKHLIQVKHTSSAEERIVEAGNIIKMAHDNFDAVAHDFRRFAKVRLSSEEMDRFIFHMLGVPPKEVKRLYDGKLDRNPRWLGVATNIKLAAERGPGSDIEGVRGTAWGGYQGLTNFFDWGVRVKRADTEFGKDIRLDSKMIGHYADMKKLAFARAKDYVDKVLN